MEAEGKLNWTDLTGFVGGCTARDFTVSITFRHLATVVEMAASSLLEGVDVSGADGGAVTAVVGGCELTEEVVGGAVED